MQIIHKLFIRQKQKVLFQIFICFLLIVTTVGLTCVLSSPVASETIDEVETVWEEKVEAIRVSAPMEEAPGPVAVITADQIEASGASNITDVLRLVSGVNARYTGMGNIFAIRSFGEEIFTERVLILVDGIPYNSPDKGGMPVYPAYELLPLELIKRIEVLKGPVSSLFGTNAFWGAVNIVTKRAEDINQGPQFKFLAGPRESLKWFGNYGLNTDKYSLLVGLNSKHEVSPFLSFAGDDPEKYDYRDIYAKLQVGQPFTISFYRHWMGKSSGSFNFVLPGIEVVSSQQLIETRLDDAHQTLNVAAVTYQQKVSPNLQVVLKSSYNVRSGGTCSTGCHSSDIFEDEKTERLHGSGYIMGNFSGMDFFPLVLGGEATYDIIEPRGKINPGADKKIINSAFFIQPQYQSNRVKLGWDLRLDFDEEGRSRRSQRIVGVIAPIKGRKHKFMLRSAYGNAFKRPNWTDQYRIIRIVAGELEELPGIGKLPQPLKLELPMIGNKDLQDEKIKSLELGGEYHYSWRDKSEAILKFDWFRSETEDFIQRYPTLEPSPLAALIRNLGIPLPITEEELLSGVIYRNFEGTAEIKGWEAEFLLALRPFDIPVDLMFSYSRQINDLPEGYENSYSPPKKFSFYSSISPIQQSIGPFEKLRLTLVGSYWSKYFAYWYSYTEKYIEAEDALIRYFGIHGRPSPREFSDYILLDLKVSTKWKIAANNYLELSFIGKNIADEKRDAREIESKEINQISTDLLEREFFLQADITF